MKNKLFFAVYTLIVFLLGAFVSFAVNHHNHDETAENNLNHPPSNSVTSLAQPNVPLPIASTPQVEVTTTASANNNLSKQTFNTQQFNEQNAKQLINALPDSQLNQYVARFIPTKDAELITDKRQFANRAVEELYKFNDSQPLVGQVMLSDSSNVPSQSMNTTILQKRQKLYAHLNTFGKVPLGANVFVKWVNRNTGEVLLFEKKLIVPDSANNWVSYQPYDGWQTGSYDIRFYQFTSQLEPVAQLSYDVNQVID